MARVSIPTVGDVEFPDSMTPEEIQRHAGRLHQIATISKRSGPVDVTRSVPFARKMIARGEQNPALTHFINRTTHDPDGRERVDFATARHALKAIGSGGKDFTKAEFHRLLHEDLKEATSRAGTRSDWLDVDKEQPATTPASQQSVMDLIRQRAAERTR